jgi:hypothetical protein
MDLFHYRIKTIGLLFLSTLIHYLDYEKIIGRPNLCSIQMPFTGEKVKIDEKEKDT